MLDANDGHRRLLHHLDRSSGRQSVGLKLAAALERQSVQIAYPNAYTGGNVGKR